MRRQGERITYFHDIRLRLQAHGCRLGGGALYPGEMEKPSAWDEMLAICRKLSAEMPFLRVDLYFVDGQVKVGELTCYPGAGWAIPEPYSLNEELGKLLPIPELGEAGAQGAKGKKGK